MADPRAVSITLSNTDWATLQTWTRRRSTARPGLGASRAHRAGLRRARHHQFGCRSSLGHQQLDGGQMATALCRARPGRLGRRTARPGAPRSILDELIEWVISTTLEHGPSGQGTGHEPDSHLAHLARFCARASPL